MFSFQCMVKQRDKNSFENIIGRITGAVGASSQVEVKAQRRDVSRIYRKISGSRILRNSCAHHAQPVRISKDPSLSCIGLQVVKLSKALGNIS